MQADIETIIESLCQSGCKTVWKSIETLESGGDLTETANLDQLRRQQVLAELKAVMAVYETGSCCAPDDAHCCSDGSVTIDSSSSA